MLIRIGEVCADVVIVDISLGRTEGVYTCRATWVMLASQVNVSMRVHRLEPDVSQGVVGEWTKEIVVPLFGICVNKERVIREMIVEINYVGEIGW